MPIRIHCPHCGSQTNISDELIGATALCGHCLEPIVITSEPVHVESKATINRAIDQATDLSGRASDFPPELVIRDEQPRRSRQPRMLSCLVACLLIFASLMCLLPAVERYGPARNTQTTGSRCKNNLRQIALALQNYYDAYRALPPPYIADENGQPMHSWRVLLLPFIEQQGLYQQYKFDEPWNGPNNSKLALEVAWWHPFMCPADPKPSGDMTNYVLVVGKNAMFENGRSTTFADVTDGLSNTIMVVEVANSNIHWMEPRDLDFETMSLIINASQNGDCISSQHTNGAHVAFGDGRIVFLNNYLLPETLRKLIDRRDGEVIDEFNDW